MPFKPSENEERFFKEQEIQARIQRLEEEQRKTSEAEKQRLKELHWLHCPKCGQKLDQEYYGKVEIDVCPGCRGLWLDAHELDAILSASAGSASPFKSFLKILGG